MYYKKQTGMSSIFLDHPFVKVLEVKCRDSCLSCTCSSYNQIAIAMYYISLILQFFQHTYLMRLSFKTNNIFGLSIFVTILVTLLPNSILKTLKSLLAVDRFKIITIPIIVECCFCLVDNMWIFYGGHSHIPLQPLG